MFHELKEVKYFNKITDFKSTKTIIAKVFWHAQIGYHRKNKMAK